MEPKQLSLAFSMSSNPGVYAVLLGSGVSRSAGLMTGWDIVIDLCTKLAHVQSEDPGDDPISWYKRKYGKDARYDDLLGELALTSDARQALLEEYFESTDLESEHGLKQPTAAHRAIAELVRAGYIRLVLTTNFDRLMETALSDIGIVPDVVYTDTMLDGMRPYVHSRCTVVKLHGDYKDTRIKNTEQELATYSKTMNQFLDRIFDEFGLIIAGWSGSWDQALKDAMLRCSSRRYCWYWLARGNVNDHAQSIVLHRDAVVIEVGGADSFFAQLITQVQAIKSIQNVHPDSAPVAIAMTKKFISTGANIELHDLVRSETMSLRNCILNMTLQHEDPQTILPIFQEQLQKSLAIIQSPAGTLAAMAAFPNELNRKLLRQSMQRLVTPRGSGRTALLELQQFPLLYCMYAAGIASIVAESYDTLKAIMVEPTIVDVRGVEHALVEQTNVTYTFEHSAEWIPRPSTNLLTPVNQFLYENMRTLLEPFAPTEAEYERAFTIFEFLVGLLIVDSRSGFEWLPAARHACSNNGQHIVSRFLSEGGVQGENWPVLRHLFDGDKDRFETAVLATERYLNRYTHRHMLYGAWELLNAYRKNGQI